MKKSLVLLCFLLLASSVMSKELKEVTIRARAMEDVKVLKDKDMAHLSRLVHPDKGLVLLPYDYMDKALLKSFNRKEIREFSFAEKSKFRTLIGECYGEPEDYTFSENYKSFVYDVDFIKTNRIAINEVIFKQKTAYEIDKGYPNAEIVQFLYPNTD